jgi:Asp/Glu/hydantoin racemase
MGALANGLSDPEPVINAAKKAAKTAIQSGAEILIPASGGLNMTLVHHGIKEINGIPIIDIHGVVIKVAELIVDLKKMGIERVNLGLYTRASKEQVQQSHELFKKYLNL